MWCDVRVSDPVQLCDRQIAMSRSSSSNVRSHYSMKHKEAYKLLDEAAAARKSTQEFKAIIASLKQRNSTDSERGRQTLLASLNVCARAAVVGLVDACDRSQCACRHLPPVARVYRSPRRDSLPAV
jgi:hypothetical protein